MKRRLVAMISMELRVPDEEYEKLKEQSMCGQFDVFLGYDNAELAERFVKDGTITNNSYIPSYMFKD